MKISTHLSWLLGISTTALITAPFLSAAQYDQMVVFGDSLSDTGNLSLALGPGVLSSLGYDSLRFTDGPGTTPATNLSGVAVEQLNNLLGLPALSPMLLGGNDYAWAKATTSASAPNFALGVTPGTGYQVSAYLNSHPQASANSLYVLWGGANDLFNATSPQEIVDAEATAITNLNLQISELLSAGAKNILWFNLPDLSRTPDGGLEGPTLAEQLHDSTTQFRDDWATSISQLEAVFPQAKITGVDAYAFLNSMLANPQTYGFTNVTGPAQGLANVNPDQYLFWDDLHPTTKADSFLADYALHTLQPVPEPSTYGLFAGVGLALVAFGRRRQRV